MWIRLPLIVLYTFVLTMSVAQSGKQVHFYSLDKPISSISDILKSKIWASDSLDAIKKAGEVIDSLNTMGYFACHVKEISETDTSFNCSVFLGELYYYSRIDLKSVPEEISVKYKLGRFLNNYSVANAKIFLQRLIQYFENEGFQYAYLGLDSTTLDKNKLWSVLKVDLGPKVFTDSVYLIGDHSLPANLLKRLITLKIGEVYSSRKLEETLKNLKSLPFITIRSDPTVAFYRNKALVRIYLNESRQSRIDALLGILPSSPPESKLKLNGTFNAILVNQFKAGESIAINFQSLQNSSQHLKLDWSSPYLFNLPFSPGARFTMFRRDSLFQEVRADISASWQVANKTKFKVQFGSFSSSLLKPDLVKIKQTKMLPAALDFKQSFATSSFNCNQLDNGSLSLNGFSVDFFISGFSRNIKKNVSIISLQNEADTSFSYESLYTPFANKGYAVEIGLLIDHFLKIRKYTVLYQSLRIHYKEASTRLQLNEMYRMGGYSTLRGFDEESVLATRYFVLKNELRLMTGNRSYLFSHLDYAIMHQYLNDNFKTSPFLSLGAGLAVDTSLGILSVTSSVGRSYPAGFDFRAVKLHVGYINYF